MSAISEFMSFIDSIDDFDPHLRFRVEINALRNLATEIRELSHQVTMSHGDLQFLNRQVIELKRANQQLVDDIENMRVKSGARLGSLDV